MSEARAGEADEIVEHGKAAPAAATPAFVVLRWQPHSEPAQMRVAERIVAQYS